MFAQRVLLASLIIGTSLSVIVVNENMSKYLIWFAGMLVGYGIHGLRNR